MTTGDWGATWVLRLQLREIQGFSHLRPTGPAHGGLSSVSEACRRLYGVSDHDRAALQAYAANAGLTVVKVPAARRFMALRSAANAVDNAFGVLLEQG